MKTLKGRMMQCVRRSILLKETRHFSTKGEAKPTVLAERLSELLKQSEKKEEKRPPTNKVTPPAGGTPKLKTDTVSINRELAKLTPLPMAWRASPKMKSSIGKFLSNAKIGHEWSIYSYEQLEQKDLAAEDLPEILLIGRCNVGKSSLINSLLTKSSETELRKYARVKDRAGYTPCLNFYNIGGTLRLVDSPGYGVKGQAWQGDLICEYLQKRSQLMNTYLILDASVGVNAYDLQAIDMLKGIGSDYDIILNKVDKVAQDKRVLQTLSVARDCHRDNPLIKRCYATSCADDVGRRNGQLELLMAFFASAGIESEALTAPRVNARSVRNDVAKSREKREKKEKRKIRRAKKESRL